MRTLLIVFAAILGQALQARDLGARPIVLVHGWGPEALINLSPFRKHLVSEGVPANSILEVTFDANDSLDTINAGITSQIQGFLAKFPLGTPYDVIGHSLGGFLGLYVPVQSIYTNPVYRYVALAGWTHGQNHLPSACNLGNLCGKTLPLIVPTDGMFLLSFFFQNYDTIQRMKKCSLWSPDDTLTADPTNSGGFPDGVNVEVKGVQHLQFKDDLDVLHIMETACYGDPPPSQGFTHSWTISPH